MKKVYDSGEERVEMGSILYNYCQLKEENIKMKNILVYQWSFGKVINLEDEKNQTNVEVRDEREL